MSANDAQSKLLLISWHFIFPIVILCISPNTNVEHSWTIPDFHAGGIFRVKEETVLASGKGVNVARSIQILGGDAHCAGFVAGHLGHLFIELAANEGLLGEWVWVPGESRQAIVLYNPEAGDADATIITGVGPQVGATDWQRLREAVLDQVPRVSAVCTSGSLPPSSPLESFAELISLLRQAGRPVWVDCSGDALLASLSARPGGVKVNALEASEVVGFPVPDVPTSLKAARKLIEMGAGAVCLTLGKDGAVFFAADEAWFVTAPGLPYFVSSVGSGDAFFAGLLLGIAQGLPVPETLRQAAAAGGANALCLGGGKFDPADFRRLLPTVSVSKISFSTAHNI